MPMECNKEEAVRAREMAEQKMQNKDFAGARKVALKAQQLFPELENLSHMLTVCEVHCSAGTKISGEMDWYGILQIEPTADDSSIKKQYRKLALLLHPDKNQFAGAEAAFKLIGEANMILSDKAKRYQYDFKRTASAKIVPYRQPAPQMRKTSSATVNYSAVNFNGLNHQQQQPSSFTISETFWTICPDCSMKYQYYKYILNKSLRCQNCLKEFTACDLNAKTSPSGVNSSQSWSNLNPHEQKPAQQASSINQQGQSGNPSSSMGHNVSVGGEQHIHHEYSGKQNLREKNHEQAINPSTANTNKKGRKVAVESSNSESSDDEDDVVHANGAQSEYCSSSAAPRRSARQKQNINYSEVGSEDDDEEDVDNFVDPPSRKKLRRESLGTTDVHGAGHSHADPDGGTSGMHANNSTDDETKSSHLEDVCYRKDLPSGSKGINTDMRSNNEPHTVMEEKLEPATVSNTHSGAKVSHEQHAFVYPDSEFCDFEKLRLINEFAVGQVWALYDTIDGMPRFYARIRKIFGPEFGLQVTWLEHCPVNDAETAWRDKELPIGCGNYVLGYSQSSDEQNMFSHVVSWENGVRRNSYIIYPRKGEVWALFKDWNIGWSSEAGSHRHYEYEVIEVLSDFAAGTGISVIPLVKVEGFVSLFIPTAQDMVPNVIPPNEMLRFSHCIPSYRLTGIKKGLPEGCLELDPASLPANFSESFRSVSLCSVATGAGNLKKSCGSCLNSTSDEVEPGISGVQQMKNEISQNLSRDDVKGVGDPKQYEASESRQSDASRHGQNDAKQSKAETSDKDKLGTRNNSGNDSEDEILSHTSSLSPLTFEYPEAEFHNFDEGKSIENVQRGQIWALYSDIDKYPKYYGFVKKVELVELKVYISWLEACPVSEEEKRWTRGGLPISCGTFNVESECVIFDSMGTFSHLVEAKRTSRRRYDIFPSLGEIWAVYKNWRIGWSRSDMENSEYDVVEISECTDAGLKVIILTKVNGYRAVFKREIEQKARTMEIPVDEYIRFSHMIPSVKLTDERGGKLRDHWELDTASVPDTLLFSDNA